MKRIVAFIALGMCLGCETATMCTLVGCENGVTVHLASVPSGVVVVSLAGDGVVPASATATCTGPAPCTFDFFFAGVTAAKLVLSVTTTASTQTRTVAPAYTTFQPNGARCGPTCHAASVVIEGA